MKLRNLLQLVDDTGISNQQIKDVLNGNIISVKDVLSTYPNYFLNTPVNYNSYTISHVKGRPLFNFNY